MEQPCAGTVTICAGTTTLEQPKKMRWNSHTFSCGCSRVNYGCSSAFFQFHLWDEALCLQSLVHIWPYLYCECAQVSCDVVVCVVSVACDSNVHVYPGVILHVIFYVYYFGHRKLGSTLFSSSANNDDVAQCW